MILTNKKAKQVQREKRLQEAAQRASKKKRLHEKFLPIAELLLKIREEIRRQDGLRNTIVLRTQKSKKWHTVNRRSRHVLSDIFNRTPGDVIDDENNPKLGIKEVIWKGLSLVANDDLRYAESQPDTDWTSGSDSHYYYGYSVSIPINRKRLLAMATVLMKYDVTEGELRKILKEL